MMCSKTVQKSEHGNDNSFSGEEPLCDNKQRLFKDGNFSQEVLVKSENVYNNDTLNSKEYKKCFRSPMFIHKHPLDLKAVGVSFQSDEHWEFIDPNSELPADCSNDQYLQVVTSVINSGVPNYQGCKVELKSNLNIPLWRDKLKDYRDKHVVNLMQYDFPLGIRDREMLQRTQIKNHSTALEFSEDVEKYIQKEVKERALLGPFRVPPHEAYHVSPLLSRPKENNQRRIIVDLSYGDQAVNGNTCRGTYEGEAFTLQLPTIDHVVAQIKGLRRPCLIKADIARAFRNILIDPRDSIKCGIAHKGEYFVDRALVFGAVNGTMIFQRVSDAVKHILNKEGIEVQNYIDDIFAAAESDRGEEHLKRIGQLIQDLGLPLNRDKVKGPSGELTIMGIDINVRDRTLAIPGTKMDEIVQICEQFHVRTECSKRDLQSLLGKLLYVSKIVKPARGFLNRMLNTLRGMPQMGKGKLDE